LKESLLFLYSVSVINDDNSRQEVTNRMKKVNTTYYAHKGLTLRRLMSYIYGAPILDVSRSHTTTQHSR